MNTKSLVYCTLEVEGVHRWETCDIHEVAYLKSPHRHVFKIKATKEVTHDDRDIEFIRLKHQIQGFMLDRFYDPIHRLSDFGTMSCEMIGKLLLDRFSLDECDVSEDGENGSIVKRA